MRRAAAAVVLAIAGSLALSLSSASASAPNQHGWWTVTNPGLVAEAPPPPDVPERGLLIEGGLGSASGSKNTAPGAFAAIVYDLGSGVVPKTLTLVVAEGSATTPASTLQLCPLDASSIEAAHGGPMADAPSFACTKNATAGASPDGRSYRFDVVALAGDHALALAVLPTSPTDRVVLVEPDAESLEVRALPSGSEGLSGGSPTAGVGPTPGRIGSPCLAACLPLDVGRLPVPDGEPPGPRAVVAAPRAETTGPELLGTSGGIREGVTARSAALTTLALLAGALAWLRAGSSARRDVVASHAAAVVTSDGSSEPWPRLPPWQSRLITKYQRQGE